MRAREGRRWYRRVEQVRKQMLFTLCNVLLAIGDVPGEDLRRVFQCSQQKVSEIAGNVHGT